MRYIVQHLTVLNQDCAHIGISAPYVGPADPPTILSEGTLPGAGTRNGIDKDGYRADNSAKDLSTSWHVHTAIVNADKSVVHQGRKTGTLAVTAVYDNL